MPSVKPQSNSGLVRSADPAWSPRYQLYSLLLNEVLGLYGVLCSSAKNSCVELQYRDSEGINLMAEKRIFPRIERIIAFKMGPPRRAKRSDTSTYSYVRTEGERRTRRGTQWADATSPGPNFRGGREGLVQRKTKGQRTIILFRN